ncbi:MAG TPA: CoA transferase [Rhizomicrobium sp.]|jgi:crotonobetainyl-CoA:carnitine CoA-transferase CaiB-like acyl-CoA transferase|nr:CoA transferase [Rhizomicrobium sp.]
MAAPFEGIRVADFGRYIAGPYCAALLADLGADVIRVEKREGREDRTLVSLAQNEDGTPREGAMFLQMNRNKRSLTCDPMNDAGREVVRRLIKSADVVVANLPAETLKAMGLDWASVSALNPRAILAVGTAFGLEGPYAGRVGFDGVAQAMSGATWFSGTEEQPVRCSAPYVDFGTASLLALGVAAALRSREQTGRGQMVEGALLRTALTFFAPTLIEEDALAIGRRPTLNRSQTAGPSDIYKAKDGWITVAVNGDPLFRRAARLIGVPEWLEDARFSSDKARGDNGEVISERVTAWVAQRTSAEAIAAFEGARVPAGPVLRPRQTLDDPHVKGGDFFVDVEYPGVGSAKVAATPVKLHGTPGTVRRRPPTLGEHTDEVLAELGFSPMEIAVLKREGGV